MARPAPTPLPHPPEPPDPAVEAAERVWQAFCWRKPARPQTLEAFLDNRHGVGYEYWVVHGTNYLASPGGTTRWRPLFPELYRSNPPLPWPRDDLFGRVMRVYLDPRTSRLDPRGVWCVLWLALRAEEMFPLVWSVREWVRRKGVDPHHPGLASAHSKFNEVGEALQLYCPRWNQLRPGDPVPPRFFSGCGKASGWHLQRLKKWREKAEKEKKSKP